MRRRFRFSLATALLGVTCFALAVGWWSTTRVKATRMISPNTPPPDEAIRQLPITIAMSEVGRFASGESWYLSVNSAGQADLTIDNRRKNRIQRFTVSEHQIDQLRELLIFHSFLWRPDHYGDIVPDGSTRTMTITVGDFSKTYRIHFLDRRLYSNTSWSGQAARALRVWNHMRGWFEHPEAVDTRKYDTIWLDGWRTERNAKRPPRAL